MNTTLTTNSNKTNPPRSLPWHLIGWSIPVALLMLPLIAMQFTQEVDWGLFDFILMGALMGIVGGGIELAVSLSQNTRYRVAAVLALLAGFMMIWVNLAVGIIGDGDHPANLLYFVVVIGGLVGVVASRFRPAGLAATMYLMVISLVLIGVGVIVTGSLPADVPAAVIPAVGAPAGDAPGINASAMQVLGITGFFSVLFLVPALLFQQAARDERALSEQNHE